MRTVQNGDILVLKTLATKMFDKFQYQFRLSVGIPHPVQLRLKTGALAERTERLFKLMRNIFHHRVGDVENRRH